MGSGFLERGLNRNLMLSAVEGAYQLQACKTVYCVFIYICMYVVTSSLKLNLNLPGTQPTASKCSCPSWCGKSGHSYQTMADERLSLLISWDTFRSSVNQALMRYLTQSDKVLARWCCKRWAWSLYKRFMRWASLNVCHVTVLFLLSVLL